MIAPGKTEQTLPKGLPAPQSKATRQASWRWVKLGEVIHRLSPATRRLKTHEYKQTGKIAIVDQGQDLIAGYTDDDTTRTGVGSPVLVFGDHTKVVKYVNFDFAIGADGVVLLDAVKGVDLRFLYYGLCQVQLPDMGYGRHYQFLGDQEIPLPPLPEQKRIAAILNEQMAAVERARKAAEERLAAVNDLPSAYLRAVFPAPDQPPPNGWRWVRLGQVLQQRKEVIHPRDNPYGPAIFVGLEHIESNTGRRTGAENVETSELTGRKPRFYDGDIVYGYLRPYLNKVWLAEFNGLCSVDQYVFSAREDLACAAYVSWFMRSPSYLDNSPVGNTPGWLPRIRTEEVSAVSLPLPPLPEQERLAAMLSEQMASVEKARKAAEEELAAINALPAALLRGAFSGEL